MPCPCRAKKVHGSLKSQSSPGPGWRREGGCDFLAGSFLQLPQTARLSLGLIQAWVLAGRGGVWQVLAWRRRTAAGPLRGGFSQVGIHQLHDLFHLRKGRGQRAGYNRGQCVLLSHPLPRLLTKALHELTPTTFPFQSSLPLSLYAIHIPFFVLL